MARSDWKDAAEFIGIVAIVASLIFVGLELKQGHDIARADVHLQRAALAIAANSSVNDPAVQAVIAKVTAGDDLTIGERLVVDGVFERTLIFYENNHYQYQLGMVPDELWLATKRSLTSDLVGSKEFRDFWERDRGNWRRSFAAIVDDLIDDLGASK